MVWVLGWCRGNRAIFSWFEGWNILLGDHQNLKKGLGSQKERESNIKG